MQKLSVSRASFILLFSKKLLSNYLTRKNLIIRIILGKKLNLCVDCLWSDFKKNPLWSFEEKLDFALSQLYTKLYEDTKYINSFKFYFLALFIYIFSNDIDTFYLYLSKLSFLMGISIDLILYNKYWMDNSLIKKNFPILHSVIKVFLLSSLMLVFYLSIETIQCIIVYIFKCLKSYLFKVNITGNNLNNIKPSSGGSNPNGSNNPQDPKDPNGMVLSPDNKPKKKQVLDFYGNEVDMKDVNQDNKEKASSLKELILQKQGVTFHKDDSILNSRTKFQVNNDLKVKVWKAPNTETILGNLIKEHGAYSDQAEKFKSNILGIESRNWKNHITVEDPRDMMYPAEATVLLKDYVVLVNLLKDNLEPIIPKVQKQFDIEQAELRIAQAASRVILKEVAKEVVKKVAENASKKR
jgi:hypothetical protein